jgi:hypothetical protein
MMKLCYNAAVHGEDHMGRLMSDAIFWVADCLEEELREKKIPTLTHALGSISSIKDMANALVKDRKQWAGTADFDNECERLGADNPEYLE